MINESKITSFNSITVLLLKELRLERNFHQAQMASFCDKTTSVWTKIETGRTPLSLEILFVVCNVLSVTPSSVLATTERYASLLSQDQDKWGVVPKQLEFTEDLLLKEAQEYYSSQGFRSRMPQMAWNMNVSVLNGPFHNPDGSISLNPVFQFALDKTFKAEQLNFKPFNIINNKI